MREDARTKARRIVAEGRLRLLHVDEETGVLHAEARGDAAIYTIVFDEHGWSCTCPARGRCSHQLAAGLVVVLHPRENRL